MLIGDYQGQTQTRFDLTPDYFTLFGVSVENAFLLKPLTSERIIWSNPRDVRSVVLSSDQKWAAVICGPTSQRMEIRYCVTGQICQTLSMESPITAVAWSPSDRWLAVTMATGRLSTWHTYDWMVPANPILANLPINNNLIRSLQFSADDRFLMITSTSGALSLYSPESAIPLVTHPGFAGSIDARISKSGQPIIGVPGSTDSLAIVGGEEYRLISENSTREAIVSSNSRWLAARSNRTRSGSYEFWDMNSGQRILSWTLPKSSRLIGIRDDAILEYRVPTYELWSHEMVRGLDLVVRLASPTLVTAFRGPKNAKNAEPSTIHFAKSPNEFVIHADEFLHLFVKQPNEGRTDRMFSWTAKNPDAFAAWSIPSSPGIVFDPNGRWIVADSNHRTTVLNRTTKQALTQLPVVPNAIWVSDERGEFLMQIGQQQAVLWRTADWQVVETWKNLSSTNRMSAAFLPGHDQFFLSRDGMIECRSSKTGTLKYEWRPPRTITDLQISPNGRYLIGSGLGLQVWDLTLCHE